MFYVRVSTLFSSSLIKIQTFRRALSASVDSCAEIKSTPSVPTQIWQSLEEGAENDVRSVKPVLNWANVCSPNILRTVRRTMIRFLTELLVCRTWFGLFDGLLLRSQLACNEMQASARTCGRCAAGSMIENVG